MDSKNFPIQVGSPTRLNNPVAVDAVYKNSPSPYSGQTGGYLNIGPRQPLIWRQPGYNSSLQNVQKYTGRGLPVASATTDVERVTKFMMTGQGVLFLGKQFILQGMNAFNETTLYNPASPVTAAARVSTLGFIDRPMRHVDTSGNMLRNLGSSLGLDKLIGSNGPIHVSGTAEAVTLPSEAKTGSKGLIRSRTGTTARQLFIKKINPANGSNGKGGFLSNLGQSLLKTYLPAIGGLPDQFSGLSGPKYRADQDAYVLMNGSSRLGTNEFTPGDKTYEKFPTKANLTTGSLVKNPDIGTTNELEISTIPDDTVFDVPVRSVATAVRSVATMATMKYSDLVPNKILPTNKGAGREVDGGYVKLIESSTEAERTLKNLGFKTGVSSGNGSIDATTGKIVVSELTGEESGPIQDLQEMLSGNVWQEQIISFWFKDVINGIYLPFSSTVKGISDSHAVDWEEVQYLGRPDKVFNYKGFTRDLSFTFIAYCMSVRDLEPLWRKINYLVGLARPSNFTDTGFFVPPLVELRMGDLYHNQPIILRTISITIPDDASWELLSSATANSIYRYGIGRNEIVIDNVRYAQVPTRIEVSVNASVLEKDVPRARNFHFGDKSLAFKFDTP